MKGCGLENDREGMKGCGVENEMNGMKGGVG